jgi:hypothetical protein
MGGSWPHGLLGDSPFHIDSRLGPVDAVPALSAIFWRSSVILNLTARAIGLADRAVTGARWQTELMRIGMVPLFVVVCYRFEWQAWRSLWGEVFVTAAYWLGLSPVRAGVDSFFFNGVLYRFVIACTALDAFFGSVPLLWKRKTTVYRNLAFLASYFVCLSVANLVRLELGFILYFHGVSWLLAHEVMAGVFYFGVFLWIARQRGWDQWGYPVNAPGAEIS